MLLRLCLGGRPVSRVQHLRALRAAAEPRMQLRREAAAAKPGNGSPACCVWCVQAAGAVGCAEAPQFAADDGHRGLRIVVLRAAQPAARALRTQLLREDGPHRGAHAIWQARGAQRRQWRPLQLQNDGSVVQFCWLSGRACGRLLFPRPIALVEACGACQHWRRRWCCKGIQPCCGHLGTERKHQEKR